MMATRMFRTALLLGLGLLASGAAQAELYKWTDEEGNVIYSQVPPPDREVQSIAPPPPPPAQAVKPAADTGAKDPLDTSDDEKANLEIVARIAKKNCEIARQNLEIYKNHSRIRNKDGQITVLDDATRAAKVKEAEQHIKDFCK